MQTVIKNRYTQKVIVESEKTLIETVVANRADLCDANLRDADLRDADLRGANLCGMRIKKEQIDSVIHELDIIVLE